MFYCFMKHLRKELASFINMLLSKISVSHQRTSYILSASIQKCLNKNLITEYNLNKKK